MQTTLIRRFTTSDQLTHFLNATAWIALGLSGISIGSCVREPTLLAQHWARTSLRVRYSRSFFLSTWSAPKGASCACFTKFSAATATSSPGSDASAAILRNSSDWRCVPVPYRRKAATTPDNALPTRFSFLPTLRSLRRAPLFSSCTTREVTQVRSTKRCDGSIHPLLPRACCFSSPIFRWDWRRPCRFVRSYDLERASFPKSMPKKRLRSGLPKTSKSNLTMAIEEYFESAT